MVNAGPLAAPTILAEMAKAGVKVAAVTAKDKLRGALAAGLVGPGNVGIAFSAEKADQCTLAENGVDAADVMSGRMLPDQYSPDLSLFVLDAGVRLVESGRADLLYLSLSDFVQHAHAPGARESDDFMQAVHARVARLLGLGATVGIVADHGMTDLSLHGGEPNILYLGALLDNRFGEGRTKVICPITDPFVRHHGALGGFVRVHILDRLDRDEVLRFISSTPGVHTALVREEACRKLELNFEREGDIAVIGAKGVALGSHKGAHQLEQLAGARLRSHGSFAERDIPFVVSRPIKAAYLQERGDAPIYNYDIFHFVLNGAE
ncbi:phosphonoacetate hydrolase [Shinella granuli]